MRRKIAAKRNMVAHYSPCQTPFEQRVQPLANMEKKPDPAGSDSLGMSEGSVKTYCFVPVGTGGGGVQFVIPQQIRNEQRETPQRWEIQGQELPTPELTPVQSPAWRNLQVPELTLTEDIETYLTTFEDVAEACKWPREQWVTRLVPALNGAALQAYNNLDPRENGDYEKVKAAILREDAVSLERKRQHFRYFHYQEAEGPRDVCSRLWELCHRWLEPDNRTKDQIIQLLILEQFLTILPKEMQEWVQEYHPKTCIQAVTLAEYFLLKQQDNDQQVLGTYMHEESVNLPESEQVVSDTQQVLCRENKEELNEHASSVAGDEIQSKNEEEYLLQESSKKQSSRLLPNLQAAAFAHQTPNSQLASKKQPLYKKEVLFPCPECGKNFSRKSTLTRHRKVHTGVKPHQCTECEKRFLHKFNLVNHMKTHMREESSRSSLCGKNAKRNSGQGSQEQKAGCCECTGSLEPQYSLEQTTQDMGE